MIYLIATVHVVVSIFLILVVLLQRGSGADLSVFGGGGTQAAFGARSAATVLHKMTVWGFVAFVVTTISYNFLAGGHQQESVLSGAAAPAGSAIEEPALPAETGEGATPAAAEPQPATGDEAVEDAPATTAEEADAVDQEATAE